MNKMAIVSFVGAMLVAGAAGADERPAREGFTLGVGLGAGRLQIDKQTAEAETNLGLSLRAGIGVSDGFLLQGTIEGTHTADGTGALDLGFLGGTATAYLFPRLYLSFGAGYAALSWTDKQGNEKDRTDKALAFEGGVGVEILQSRHAVLDAELRGFTTTLGDTNVRSGMLLLGVQFF